MNADSKRMLNASVLLPGDIILVTRDAKSSKGIRKATKSDVSHAMIYVEGYSVIDSDPEGVHARNIQRLSWSNLCAAYVLRMRDGLSDDQVQPIVAYARSQIGARYTYIGAARSSPQIKPLSRESRSPKQFCSRLVARAYEYAGIRLAETPDFCTPEDLKKSPLLEEIPNAVLTASDEFISAMDNIVDITKIMRDATNAVLTGAREIYGKIESLNDIDSYLAKHPEHDATISRLFRESGYLTVWQVECDKNPWHYNLDLMLSIGGRDAELREYCEAMLNDRESSLQRFEVNRAGYSILLDQYGLQTFRLMKELHDTLIKLHAKRCDVARRWLSLHAPESAATTEPQPSAPVPHSPEWFAALEQFNPMQAAQTRLVIRLAGTPDVCSVCGDAPSKDYRLVGHKLSESAVKTLRLCDDCWGLRRGMYTESLGLM
jgi:uncharacterized protein YycO